MILAHERESSNPHYVATARLNLLSLEEFRHRYAEEKPYFEYWFGEAVQKSLSPVLHALLVKISGQLGNAANWLAKRETIARPSMKKSPTPCRIPTIQRLLERQ